MLKLDDPFSLFLLVLSLLLKREDHIYGQKFVAWAKKHSCEAQNEIELIAQHNPPSQHEHDKQQWSGKSRDSWPGLSLSEGSCKLKRLKDFNNLMIKAR
jgi:hypothetical protein